MKKIFVQKTLKYDPTEYGKYSLYQGYCSSAVQKSNPAICEDIIPHLSSTPTRIFSSPLLRAKQTTLFFQKKYNVKKIEIVAELSEVIFDLKKLVSETEFEQQGSFLVRKRFIESFKKDTLAESRYHIQSRLRKVITMFELLPQGFYLVVTHSFFMKLMEIYMKEKDIFENPDLITKFFDVKRRTYEFGEGFSFTL